MTTDRELIEAAARAGGMPPWEWSEVGQCIVCPHPSDLLAPRWAAIASPVHHWNPLADDGDALRLAVKLDLQIRQVHFKAHVGWPDKFWETERHGDDKAAATRRAIVRAAVAVTRTGDIGAAGAT